MGGLRVQIICNKKPRGRDRGEGETESELYRPLIAKDMNSLCFHHNSGLCGLPTSGSYYGVCVCVSA